MAPRLKTLCVVVAFVVVAIGAGCRDDGTHYNRGDVIRAFRSERIRLLPLTSRLSTPETRVVFLNEKAGEVMLVPTSGGLPNSGGPFLVLLFQNDRRATFAFQTLRSQATPDTLDLRQRNVVVTSDEGVTPALRKRIRRALARLR